MVIKIRTTRISYAPYDLYHATYIFPVYAGPWQGLSLRDWEEGFWLHVRNTSQNFPLSNISDGNFHSEIFLAVCCHLL